MPDYLEILNEPQRAAVLHKEGPMMIIAGAGSGKTRVLTYRIARLMQTGIDPFNILALTFTNKAAREMKERIAAVVGASEAKNIWMGTFHSIFARILRLDGNRLGFSQNFTIYDTQDSERLIGSIIKEMGLDKEKYKPKRVASRISTYKNNLITVHAYFNKPELLEADTLAGRPKTGYIYKEYVNRCFKADAMDFDDLLLRTNELLARFPDVLAKYQDRFRYILVDEYQDTNHSQYIIIRALADRHQNICVVGDDSQSIYGFRGANIHNILNFNKDYPNAAVFKLEQNYRSTGHIVLAANSVIRKNKMKLDKNLWTHNTEGEKVLIKELESDREEGRYIARSIQTIKAEKKQSFKDFAILYRTNAQSRAIEDALRKEALPYRIYGGLSFYQRKEVKDILAYLRLIINPADEEALKRIINYPARGIGATTLDKLILLAKENGKTLFESLEDAVTHPAFHSGIKNKLDNFRIMIESFRVSAENKNALEVAEEVVKKSGIIKYLESTGDMEELNRIENIQELLNGIHDFIEQQNDQPDADLSLTGFLQDVALATDFDHKPDENKDVISLMTVHMSKGLEFPYVYITGMEEGLFPSAMNMSTREDLEEERRLFYVALTRAERKAVLTYVETRFRWGKLNISEPSRFIDEIDEEHILHETRDIPTPGSSFLDASLFEPTPKEKIRRRNPPRKKPITPKKNLKPLSQTPATENNTRPYPDLQAGNRVEHAKFGKGTVIKFEGDGSDIKAIITFDDGVGEKKLLLRFAKLRILS